MTDTGTVTPVHYSPYDYAIHEDPYPTYTRLRAEAPLYRNDEFDFWALSRHADVLAAFRDPSRLSNRFGVTLDPSAYGPHAHKSMSFLAMDPPRHTRMRSLVSKAFTTRRVAELEPQIRALAVRYLDAAVESGSFDMIGDVAGKLPMDVISQMIGVPETDRAEVRRLADLLVHREEGVFDVPQEGMEAALVLAGYFADMVTGRRRARRDDLTSGLLDAELDGDRLSDDEIISFLFLMVVAGNETTTKLLANAWYWAWRFPDQKAKALADAGRAPQWVEETLRYDTSSQMLLRVTTGEVELLGTVLPDGGACPAARGIGQPRPRRLPRPRPLRPRPGHHQAHQLRRRPPLLPGRPPGPARGQGHARGARGPGARLRHRRSRLAPGPLHQREGVRHAPHHRHGALEQGSLRHHARVPVRPPPPTPSLGRRRRVVGDRRRHRGRPRRRWPPGGARGAPGRQMRGGGPHHPGRGGEAHVRRLDLAEAASVEEFAARRAGCGGPDRHHGVERGARRARARPWAPPPRTSPTPWR